MRDCPTVEGSSFPLIVHRIAPSVCLDRQQCHYHKCHRCVFRGHSATWSPEPIVAAMPPAAAPALPPAVPQLTPAPAREAEPAVAIPAQAAPRRDRRGRKPVGAKGKQASPA